VTRNAADADDIVQDAFCRLLRAEVDGLDGEALRRYLFRIAGNLMGAQAPLDLMEPVQVAVALVAAMVLFAMSLPSLMRVLALLRG
jgi:Sigma-70 region 2